MADPADAGAPLPDAAPAEPASSDGTATATPARAPAPPFNPLTFLYIFLFLLGFAMIFDGATRNQVATLFGNVLAPAIGFGGNYLLLTMFLAAVIEMLLTALATNWATDWVKTAQAASWGTAFRKVQMEALRSGKKDRVDALKPHQEKINQLSAEVSFASLKGLAVTWFLIIAIYTWVGLYLAGLCQYANGTCADPAAVTVPIGSGASLDLMAPILGPITTWFLLFSLYTVPMSLLFRRLLKHYSLGRTGAGPAATTGPGSGATGGTA